MNLTVEQHAGSIRRKIIETANVRSDGHFGGSLSCVDFLTVLYAEFLRNDPLRTDDIDRDRFILSKGHCALALYATLNEFGFVSDDELKSFHSDGSDFQTHPVKNVSKGVEVSSGSLGLGLSMSGGIAWALRERHSKARIYTLTGNGEMNEGIVWESIMFMGANRLENVTLVVDCNGMQNDGWSKEVLDVADWRAKLSSFGWICVEIDGHDLNAIRQALKTPHQGCPLAIVMHTVKGKGVHFMENKSEWHHGKLSEIQYNEATLALLGGVQ